MAGNYSSEGLRNVKDMMSTLIGNIQVSPGIYYQISDIVKSEDSNLAEACENTGNIGDQFHDRIWSLQSQAEQSLEAFIEATIANEQEAQFGVTEINDELSSISSMLDGLSF